MKTILIYFLLFFIVISNPIGDALRDNGKKELQKNIEILTYLSIFSFLYIYPVIPHAITLLILSYACLRISLHNIFYNLTHKPRYSWYHTGTTSLFDRLIEPLTETKIRRFFLILALLFYFSVGILLINKSIFFINHPNYDYL